MKIKINTMFGTTHSWAVTMRSLAKEFSNLGADLYINSTNGKSLVDDFFTPLMRSCFDADMEICYTLPRNFQHRFSKDSKLKLAIYNYETSIMPNDWIKAIDFVDFVLPSSNFSKDIFIKNGWPEEKCIVIPHGINLKDFETKNVAKNIKNNKKFRFLNISIPHYRKNIYSLVDAYYSAFDHTDDVCLVLKTSLKSPNPNHPFECNVTKEILKAQKKHKKRMLPQIEVLEHRYDSLVPVYNACDCLVSATSAEGFGLPLLEGLAAKMIVIAPNYSGHTDFLTSKNSLLYEARVARADKRYQYWRASDNAETSYPNVEKLAELMIHAYKNKKMLSNKFEKNIEDTVKSFTWESAAKKIMELV